MTPPPRGRSLASQQPADLVLPVSRSSPPRRPLRSPPFASSFCLPSVLVAGQGQSPARQVNGVLGGSALLSVTVAPQARVKEVEWSFRAGPGPALLVGVFRDGKFERPDPSDRFKQRVELYNETLRIKALELNDSGVFGARVKLLPAIVEDQTFRLAVYGRWLRRWAASPPGTPSRQSGHWAEP